MRGVHTFFGEVFQHWNEKYHAAQSIFGPGPGALTLRGTIHTAHRALYAHTARDGSGPLESPTDVLALLHGEHSLANMSGSARGLARLRRLSQTQQQSDAPHATKPRVKPAVYTYVITEGDETLRFSETGAAFFTDFASKHALHANCATRVRYSGEFHPRPACPGGWAGFDDGSADPDADERTRWELVIDNNSGTYAPSREMLPALQALLEYNFPGLTIRALDREDPELNESREACREYALKFRGVMREELQPHTAENEQTLFNQVAGNAGHDSL